MNRDFINGLLVGIPIGVILMSAILIIFVTYWL
jgi:hypothetical protein